MRMIRAMYQTHLGPGALYGAIARLEAKKLITALPLDDRRRPYQITEAGLRLLQAQLDTMRRLTSRGSEPPAVEEPKPLPSFYELESDGDVVDEMDQYAAHKPVPYNQAQLPFIQLGARRFEILTYLLKRDEEPENAVITLVKASRDGGRDVLVHLGGFLHKVVQCKNLGYKFSQPALLEELLKFVLHDYRERYIPESGISYELWAPGGLTEPADTWLAEWPRSLTADELRIAFDNVLRTNKTLHSLDWAEVKDYVVETLTNRIRLCRHEAASLSRKVRSASDLYAQFFEVTVTAKLEHVEEVLTPHFRANNEQLANLTDAFHGNDIDDEINEARDLVNEHQFRDAAVILKRLESKKRHRLDNHQRYRIASNYGAIAFGEDRVEDAARYFLAAVRLAPEDERARVNEVFAYYLLKDSPRAFQLATEQRSKYPFNARLVGIWINSCTDTDQRRDS